MLNVRIVKNMLLPMIIVAKNVKKQMEYSMIIIVEVYVICR